MRLTSSFSLLLVFGGVFMEYCHINVGEAHFLYEVYNLEEENLHVRVLQSRNIPQTGGLEVNAQHLKAIVSSKVRNDVQVCNARWKKK